MDHRAGDAGETACRRYEAGHDAKLGNAGRAPQGHPSDHDPAGQAGGLIRALSSYRTLMLRWPRIGPRSIDQDRASSLQQTLRGSLRSRLGVRAVAGIRPLNLQASDRADASADSAEGLY